MTAPDGPAKILRDARGLMPYATNVIVVAPDPDRADGIMSAAFNRAKGAPCAAQIAAVLRELADEYEAAHNNGACGHEASGGPS